MCYEKFLSFYNFLFLDLFKFRAFFNLAHSYAVISNFDLCMK